MGILTLWHVVFRCEGDGKIQKRQDIHLSYTSPNLREVQKFTATSIQSSTFLYISSVEPATESQDFSQILRCGHKCDEYILTPHGDYLTIAEMQKEQDLLKPQFSI